ncbi:SNF2-related protein [Ktedonobacter sp. SOSP1-52]|uniref:SNF2-related protein n=1 Tax=Ktedonobacter sp. SOSP1-52 TaxID=2778366 RepID=UPI001915A70E|nr:SNF2-related protein [Ktedonobacter sp. SOSP1-52]
MRLDEGNIHVSSDRQNYPPALQLFSYEFQNPSWKFPRDYLIQAYRELHNVTFGVDELVSARVMLLAHQAEVVSRVLADTTCRYILADEVGLGKTIEACVILKGLRRRNPSLKALIIVPSALARQWHNELNEKFWLDFPIVSTSQQIESCMSLGGCILCVEELARSEELWLMARTQKWGVLIVDEAHHLHKLPELYQRVHQLSSSIEKVLILSATPIQRYAREYLYILSLMNPSRYKIQDLEAFEELLQAQAKIRRRMTLLGRTLTEEDFDAEEFVDEMDHMWMGLKQDTFLMDLINKVDDEEMRQGDSLSAAKEVFAYVSENYQIERRIIRNRRVHITAPMPRRELDPSWAYVPSIAETEALEELYEYINAYSRAFTDHPLVTEYCKVWMYASASSPSALLDVLESRIAYVTNPVESAPPHTLEQLLVPAAPRSEEQRINGILEYGPLLEEERLRFLEPLLVLVERWQELTEQALTESLQRFTPSPPPASHRLVSALNALHEIMSTSSSKKVIVFSGWLQTLETLLPYLEHRYGRNAIAQFTCSLNDEQLQNSADTFQSVPHCRILLSDELGGEGRNFQIADLIIHIDLPWTPAQIEQRIGRVDRFGKSGTVRSVVPYGQDWPEEDLFHIWQDAFHLFTRSMSGMEIVLEGVQEELLAAIKEDPRWGVSHQVKDMVGKAEKLREEVEEERYFEEASVHTSLRGEFDHISERFQDGELLRTACLKWARIAGLYAAYDSHADIVTFYPKRFNIASMNKARFLNPPNMEEALRRSGRKNNLVIRGTFNREIAVHHEELVFFAPGNDPWIDAIVDNAIEADRGRCCAILRHAPAVQGTWRGFELLFSLTIDPRPLYQLGYDPAHLFRALGFLHTSTVRLLISEEGRRESTSSAVWKLTQRAYSSGEDIHLGKRDGAVSRLQTFKREHPVDEWHTVTDRTLNLADTILSEELDEYMEELAGEARDRFEKQAAGLKAIYHWRNHYINGQSMLTWEQIEDHERISQALVEGIRRPIRNLESACYWVLQGK